MGRVRLQVTGRPPITREFGFLLEQPIRPNGNAVAASPRRASLRDTEFDRMISLRPRGADAANGGSCRERMSEQGRLHARGLLSAADASPRWYACKACAP